MSSSSDASGPNGNPTSGTPGNSVPFKVVYLEELSWIKKRRAAFRNNGNLSPTDDDDKLDENLPDNSADRSQPLLKVQEAALDADLCGLAISGGGIRSATFSLGVLQGLAMTGLLPRIDYLSTVSGGGYIGGWYSAWVNRDGFKQVEEKLLPPRMQSSPPPEVEAEPIRHLRLYSNYLAPRPGLFSFDGWVLIAIYLRNLLLNQLVLILAVISLFAGARTVVECFSLAHVLPSDSVYLKIFSVVGGISMLIPLVGIWFHAPLARKKRKKWRDSRLANRTSAAQSSNPSGEIPGPPNFSLKLFWTVCVIPWLVAAFFVSLLFVNSEALNWFKYAEGSNESLWHWGEAVVALGLVHSFLGLASFSCRYRAMVCGFFTGIVGAAILIGLWIGLLSISQFPNASPSPIDLTVATTATFGLPLCLISFVLTNFLMVGFCGPKLKELEREWWSSVNSRMMFLAIAWTLLFGVSNFGPWLLISIWNFASSQWWKAVATGTLGTSWFGLLLTGLRAASSSSTGPSHRGGIRENLAKLAPLLFLVTLFLGAALCTTWLAYDFYVIFSTSADPTWYFHNRDNYQLLTDLNEPKWLKSICPYLHISLPVGLFCLMAGTVAFVVGAYFVGQKVGVNTFSLQNLYSNRLVRCYLGASKWNRYPDPLVNMDPHDDVEISTLFPGPYFERRRRAGVQSDDFDEKLLRIKAERAKISDPNQLNLASVTEADYWGPLYIVNGALNQKASTLRNRTNVTKGEQQAENLQFLERQAESFVFTPLYCGSESTEYCASYEYARDVKLGTAVSVSGAAVSPNMGYHSSPSITALLTVFNIRLGAWFGNPKFPTRVEDNPRASAWLMLSEMAGVTDSSSDYVYISDGGHFENMGVYELIRRRCRFIVAVDAGADPKFHENVGRLVRQVRIDFGIWVEVDMSTVSPGANGLSQSHVIVGRIHYGDVHKPDFTEPDQWTDKRRKNTQNPNDPNFAYGNNHGIIVWIKNSLTGDEPGDLVNHAAMYPTFPYDTTLDQFFSEPQFESYRALGVHSVLKSLVYPVEQILKSSTSETVASGISSGSPAGNVYQHPLKGFSTFDVFDAIYNHWLTRPSQFVEAYLKDNDGYAKIQTTLRTDPNLKGLAIELYGTSAEREQRRASGASEVATMSERLMINEMFTLLENVFLSLDLERNYLHPVHQGWMSAFRSWVNAPLLKNAWYDQVKKEGLKTEYSPAFSRFIDQLQEKSGPQPHSCCSSSSSSSSSFSSISSSTSSNQGASSSSGT